MAEAQFVVHKRRSNKFYVSLKQMKEYCKHKENALCLTFDFLQNICLPHIPVQQVYYLKQLTVNVFSIHNVKSGEAHFFIYHEGIAKKGGAKKYALSCSHV